MLSKKSLIFVSGHNGLVGSSVVRRLKFHGYYNLIFRTRKQLDLKNQSKVFNFFKKHKINAVINAAGKVGGIYANNKYRANFIYDNIAIQNNIIITIEKKAIKIYVYSLLVSNCVNKLTMSFIKSKLINSKNKKQKIIKGTRYIYISLYS